MTATRAAKPSPKTKKGAASASATPKLSVDEKARYKKLLDAMQRARDDQAMPRTAKVNFGALLVPMLDKGKRRMRPLDEVTVAQVEEATKALHPQAPARAASPSQSKLTRAFAKRKSVTGATVTVRDGMLTVKNVSLTSVPALIEALRELDR